MPLCPSCRTEQTKRVRGACPNCGTSVDVYKGRWFESGPYSPSERILTHFEDRVSDALSFGMPARVVFSIPRRGLSYKRELASAGRLLELADHDLGLTMDAVNLLFDNPKLNWKIRQTLLWVEKDYLVALALARSIRAAKEAKEDKNTLVVSSLLAKEDIFS